MREAIKNDKKISVEQKEAFMTEAKRKVEEMFKQSEKTGEKRGKEQGTKEGLAQAVLHVLKARGIRVTQTLRQRIVSCTDVRQLTAWAERAAVANSADDLFAAA